MIDARNVHATIGKHMLADGMDQVIDLKKSHGSWLVDARDGKEYLDLFSMFASMPVGYNHPTMLENRERIADAALNKPTNSDIYSTQMAEFVDTVGRIAQPDYLPYAFFVEGGALGVENALKTAFDWKVRKNLAAGKEKKGSKVIHFRECFHGRTGYTMSLTDSPDPRKTLYFPQFDWPRIINPKLHFPLTDEVLEHILKAEATAINEIKSAVAENPDDIASLIIEPIQGEGGDNHFRGEFFQELRALADEHEFMLIYDEVQTGVGITGKMWAHQHFCDPGCAKECTVHCKLIEPDLMSFGKKTQCCGMFAGKRLDEVEGHVFKESSRINSTFGGNLVDMVRFTLYLEVIEQEDLVQKAAENGEYLLTSLLKLQDDHDGLVSNARGKGLFCAYDLPTGAQRDTLTNLLEEEGAIVLGCGHKSIRFRPHLNIKRKEIDTGISMMRNALARL